MLAVVSDTFSNMRGIDSEVVKTEKGFSINGLPVHRLSGSAKAILGIAVRSALRDIFSTSPFMVLDEPFDGMDESRAASAMSAICSIQGQVLLITHEDVSDSSANNLVEV